MAVSVGLVTQLIEQLAPKSWAEEWDNVGLLVGNASQQVSKILIALDGTPEVVQEAKAIGAELVLAHHPLMFKPLKNLRDDNIQAQIPLDLIRNKISYYAAHTNLDQSELSSASYFADILELESRELLAVSSSERLVKIAVFVPLEAVEDVREALAKVGVGESITQGPHSDNYEECFFQSSGQGMFRPLVGADPAIGEIGQLTRVNEVKLESVMPERLTAKALKALLKAHPYEEPAFDLIPLNNPGKNRGYGAIGRLSSPQPLGKVWERFLEVLKQNNYRDKQVFTQNYALNQVRLAGNPDKMVQKIAIANGSGAGFALKALAKGVDLYITGDIDHHTVLDCLQGGMGVGALGHFISEAPMLTSLQDFLKTHKAVQGVEIIVSRVNSVPWVD